MDSYIVRIYRRAGGKSRILVGTVEAAGSMRKMTFPNIEELWEILRHQKGWDVCAPPSLRRRLQKEVMSGKARTDPEESAEGVRKT